MSISEQQEIAPYHKRINSLGYPNGHWFCRLHKIRCNDSWEMHLHRERANCDGTDEFVFVCREHGWEER